MPGTFVKRADWFAQKVNAANANDTIIGGALSIGPSGLNASQQTQTQPGDRVIFSPMDAVAMQNSTTGNLYTGTYRYVNMANATSTPARGHAAFWVPRLYDANNFNQATQDALYQVTSDEAANLSVSLFAGVYLNTPGKSNNNGNIYWWIQESGKASCQFRNAISGTPSIGQGVYLAAGGNNNNAIDVGAMDQIFGLNQGTIFAANGTAGYNAIDNAFVRFVGVAEQLPANNTVTVVDVNPRFFRW